MHVPLPYCLPLIPIPQGGSKMECEKSNNLVTPRWSMMMLWGIIFIYMMGVGNAINNGIANVICNS